ncbi:MAG: hypothetical protein IKA61_02180 [Clostridia bacterium]|nr:hypothetical protein [Clostridia bacterium]
MDVVIIKTRDEFVAFSLLPVGVIGWGRTKKDAISSINDNLYDYCNWLLKPLPKDPEAKAVEEYSGEISCIGFKGDCKSLAKKYAEVVVQTAFSFKCMTDSFALSEGELTLLNNAYAKLKIDGGAIIGHATDLSENADPLKCRDFIYTVYKTAREIFFSALKRGETPTDCFKFNV